jgi:uncharacterized membrane protein
MYDRIVFLALPFLLVIFLVLSGPAAFVISIIALKKINALIKKLNLSSGANIGGRHKGPFGVVGGGEQFPERPSYQQQRYEASEVSDKPSKVKSESVSVPSHGVMQPGQSITEPGRVSVTASGGGSGSQDDLSKPSVKKVSIEQQIGTRWVLFAGILALIVGVCFFLKYAYDNFYIGPWGRVGLTAVAGLLCIGVGEVTRRRNYELAAKGVCGLGFVMLFTSVFTAYGLYGLLGTFTAFVLAVLITAAAALYALSINEIVIAVISLLGGYLTPVLVSSGENMAAALFTYVLILSFGALACAFYKRWPLVNIISFTGTYGLYTGWFEKFFREQMSSFPELPVQFNVALGWLVVFFAIYLILPLCNGFIRKCKSRKEDILLVVFNASVVFYYLWVLLYQYYKFELMLCSLGLCTVHFVLLAVTHYRLKKDSALQLVLFVIGTAFLTIALPLHFRMYTLATAWSVEAVVLIFVSLVYRSKLVQASAFTAVLLGVIELLSNIPIHIGAFDVFLNSAFGAWVFVSCCLLIIHLVYRNSGLLKFEERMELSQVYYIGFIVLLSAGAMMEWYLHCEFNVSDGSRACLIKGIIVLFSLFSFVFLCRPLRPGGVLAGIFSTGFAFAGAAYTVLFYGDLYEDAFTIFTNLNFWVTLLISVSMFVGGWFCSRFSRGFAGDRIVGQVVWLGSVIVLWLIINEQIYYYWLYEGYAGSVKNWGFLASMYLSIFWAFYGFVLMVFGFWGKLASLRYMALVLFGVLLLKVFIIDMSNIESVYRIAAFLSTGVTLVVIGYFYQHLKNKGFFESFFEDKV